MAKLKYQDDFPKIAEDYARKGATDKDIARRLGISQDRFYNYLKRFPEFYEALKRGKIPAAGRGCLHILAHKQAPGALAGS